MSELRYFDSVNEVSTLRDDLGGGGGSVERWRVAAGSELNVNCPLYISILYFSRKT